MHSSACTRRSSSEDVNTDVARRLVRAADRRRHDDRARRPHRRLLQRARRRAGAHGRRRVPGQRDERCERQPGGTPMGARTGRSACTRRDPRARSVARDRSGAVHGTYFSAFGDAHASKPVRRPDTLAVSPTSARDDTTGWQPPPDPPMTLAFFAERSRRQPGRARTRSGRALRVRRRGPGVDGCSGARATRRASAEARPRDSGCGDVRFDDARARAATASVSMASLSRPSAIGRGSTRSSGLVGSRPGSRSRIDAPADSRRTSCSRETASAHRMRRSATASVGQASESALPGSHGRTSRRSGVESKRQCEVGDCGVVGVADPLAAVYVVAAFRGAHRRSTAAREPVQWPGETSDCPVRVRSRIWCDAPVAVEVGRDQLRHGGRHQHHVTSVRETARTRKA